MQAGIIAKDIWLHDERKINYMKNERDFYVFVVWESEQKIIYEKLKEIIYAKIKKYKN